MSKLAPMRYKGYTWRNNPARCTYTCERTVVRHRYPELSGSDLEDLNLDGVVIVGDGEFFGDTALSDWNGLLGVFKSSGPGEFYHPLFGDVTRAILKKLEANIEPRENYISYNFEFWQDIPPVAVVQPIPITISSAPRSGGYDTYTVQPGDCLWNILIKFHRDPTTWPYVGRYNNLKNPNLIYPGQVLRIPR